MSQFVSNVRAAFERGGVDSMAALNVFFFWLLGQGFGIYCVARGVLYLFDAGALPAEAIVVSGIASLVSFAICDQIDSRSMRHQ